MDMMKAHVIGRFNDFDIDTPGIDDESDARLDAWQRPDWNYPPKTKSFSLFTFKIKMIHLQHVAQGIIAHDTRQKAAGHIKTFFIESLPSN